MTDLHCHMLCSVDDGARNVEQMQNMLDIAYNDGIRAICFTPHFKMHHFDSEEKIVAYNDSIKQSFSIISDYSANAYPDMKLFLGSEIMFHHDIYNSVKSGKCSKIGNSSYYLVEFMPSTPFFEIKNSLSNLARKGVRLILAHVERYEDLARNYKKLKDLKELGILLQVNASSIVRLKFGKSARFIKKLFKEALVDIIATDAHDDKDFSPLMSHAVQIISQKYGEGIAKKVSCINPTSILENKNIH